MRAVVDVLRVQAQQIAELRGEVARHTERIGEGEAVLRGMDQAAVIMGRAMAAGDSGSFPVIPAAKPKRRRPPGWRVIAGGLGVLVVACSVAPTVRTPAPRVHVSAHHCRADRCRDARLRA